MKSPTGSSCAAPRSCSLRWTAPRSFRREWTNCSNGPGRRGNRSHRMLNEVLKQIKGRERFLLTSHARPDGDAVGSTLACGELLRQLGKDVEIILHDGVPRIYQHLPFAETVAKGDRVTGKYD